jgi:nitroimidazol reductase NimA-like FMN-containing flavoprotein (pyridoxamine 5'-phosphate oxidase superfamily)
VRVIRDRPRTLDLDEFLSRPLFAYLATVSEFGPRVSPVWFLWEEGAIWIIGNRRSDTFPAQVEREPRCAATMVDFDRHRGMVHHVGMRGRATVAPFDRERALRLLRRYLGPDPAKWDAGRFVRPLDDADTVLVRFDPQTVVVRDQSYEVAAPAPS